MKPSTASLFIAFALVAPLAKAQQNTCRECPDKYSMAPDNKCYKLHRIATHTVAMRSCVRWAEASIVTDYDELKAATSILGLKAVWTVGRAADGATFFDPTVPVRPSSSRNVKTRPKSKCLAFRNDGIKLPRFFAGKCTTKCPVICKIKVECRGSSIFTWEGINWELDAYFLKETVRYDQAKRMCESMGAALPFIPNRKATKAAFWTSCAYDTPNFWVNAREDGANLNWVRRDGSEFVNSNSYVDVTQPAAAHEAYYYTASDRDSNGQVLPGNKMGKKVLVCMYPCTGPQGDRLPISSASP